MIKIRILSLDQSTKCTGWSLFVNNKLKDYGTLDSNIQENNPIERMKEMQKLIKNTILKTKPDFIVIEAVQYQNNKRTYSQLSQLQGVLFSLFFELNIGFLICESTAWKSFCKIRGKKRDEQKLNTIQFVKEKYGMVVSEDIADAIGLGWWATNNIQEGVIT